MTANRGGETETLRTQESRVIKDRSQSALRKSVERKAVAPTALKAATSSPVSVCLAQKGSSQC